MDMELLTRLILILGTLVVILWLAAYKFNTDALTNFGSMIMGLVRTMISAAIF
jgi:hypothetical protein